MICNTWIIDVTTKKAKNSKIMTVCSHTINGKFIGYDEANSYIDRIGLHKDTKVENLRHCDGKITVEIKAVDEPYYGGSSAMLEVNYKCDKCEFPYYESLPNQYNINEFMKNIIEFFDEQDIKGFTK